MATWKTDTNSGKFECAVGNLKIGADTLIYNMGSATNCASGEAGLCELFNTRACYALKSEIQYPAVIPYRNRQEFFWKTADVMDIAEAIQKAFNRNTKVKLKYVRFNEAGDMHSAECLSKLKKLATILPEITFYTYTHRSDLVTDPSCMPKNLVINTSNFKVEGMNQFKVDMDITAHSVKAEYAELKAKFTEKYGKGTLVCKGDCSKCNLCKVQHGKTVWVPLH